MAKKWKELKDTMSPEQKERIEAPEPWISKVTDDWLPLPSGLLHKLGWTEGTLVELFTIAGTEQVIVRKAGYVKDVGQTGGVDGKTEGNT